jgi:hypothetical protein
MVKKVKKALLFAQDKPEPERNVWPIRSNLSTIYTNRALCLKQNTFAITDSMKLEARYKFKKLPSS